MTVNMTYPVGNPETPVDIFIQANQYVGGVLPGGMAGVIWFVIIYGLQLRNYRTLDSLIAANFATTVATYFMFSIGFASGVLPMLFGTFFAVSLGYSVANQR